MKVIVAKIILTQDIKKKPETGFIFIDAIFTKVLNEMFALKNKAEHNSTHGWFSYRHAHATYNL